jgi:hypothetical protein
LELGGREDETPTLTLLGGDPLGTSTRWRRVFSGLMLVTSNPAARSSESSLLL